MKVAVINFSGTVGKSVISNAIANLTGAEHWALEIRNAAEGARIFAGADELRDAVGEMAGTSKAVVVDIGASDAERVIASMEEMSSALKRFDRFVIPSLEADKTQKESIDMINSLIGLGVPAAKISVVINRYKSKKSVAAVCHALASHCADTGARFVEIGIPEMSFFTERAGLFEGDPWTCVADATDWSALIAGATGEEATFAVNREMLRDGAGFAIRRFTPVLERALA